ncbi:hypothetical protein [Aureliella helgolandensis]|nr:hypothetical protein [Aureliella helgolandensis]
MMLSDSPAAARDAFVEIGMLIADLTHTPNVGPASSGNHTRLVRAAANRASFRFGRWVSLAAGLLLAVVVGAWLSTEQRPSLGRLDSLSNCLWRAETAQARDGGRIEIGHFRLAEGIATIRFDNGARVELEGSSHLAVLAEDHCQLHRDSAGGTEHFQGR